MTEALVSIGIKIVPIKEAIDYVKLFELFLFLDIGSCSVVQAGLELISNFQPYILQSEKISLGQQAWLSHTFKCNTSRILV